MHLPGANAAGTASVKAVSKYHSITVVSGTDEHCGEIVIHTGSMVSTAFTNAKTLYQGAGDILQASQQDQVSKFSLTHFYKDNLFLSLRKSSLIFPFHYFW